MKKFAQLVCFVLVGMTTLFMTSCKDTSALKAAIDEASKACPLTLDNLGEATAIALGENEVNFTVKPIAALLENDKIDKSLVARYLALELQRKNPELVKQMVDCEFGIKCNIDGEEGDILVAADELRKFSNEFIAAGGKVAPSLLPLYNQQIGAKMPMDIAEGLSLHKVKVVDGVETFFVNIDEDKVKFTELRDNIVNVARKIEKAGEAGASKADIEEKVKLSKMNLSLLLPILQELNYGAMWRFATKSGSETYLEITNDEIKTYLAPAEEEPAEDKAA